MTADHFESLDEFATRFRPQRCIHSSPAAPSGPEVAPGEKIHKRKLLVGLVGRVGLEPTTGGL
jgi:hypothetical protein